MHFGLGLIFREEGHSDLLNRREKQVQTKGYQQQTEPFKTATRFIINIPSDSNRHKVSEPLMTMELKCNIHSNYSMDSVF